MLAVGMSACRMLFDFEAGVFFRTDTMRSLGGAYFTLIGRPETTNSTSSAMAAIF